MSFDAHKNFAYTTVTVPPSPAASGTSLTVADATVFPATPFNVVIWPTGAIPQNSNAEVVRVTNIAGNVLTITRIQEGSSARTVVAGDQIANNITAKIITDVEGIIPVSVANGGTGLTSGTSGGILGYTAAGTIASSIQLVANAIVVGGGAGATPTSNPNVTINALSQLSSSTQNRTLITNSSNQALVTATLTPINFDTETYDVGTMHDTVTNNSRVTIPTSGDGLYLIQAQIEYASNATGYRMVRIRKNGATTLSTSFVNAVNGDVSSDQAFAIVNLVATDYVELIGYQTSGGNLNVNANNSFLAVTKLW